MTATTQTVREQAFRPLEGDIPEGMTIARYRSGRRDRREPAGPRQAAAADDCRRCLGGSGAPRR